ncbi:three-helix bundle dimerization domain-containing protein [Streptomyces aureus]|uniref:three-helix bundle dimerization domain-containing protein n=1 Tax=Streptomyces aureus TaxID=193461 RepID=UPI0007C72558
MTAYSYPVLPDERLAPGVARLAVRLQGRYSVETVQRLVADSYEQLAANAHVSTHLGVLAERFAAERVDAPAHVEYRPANGRGCCSCAATTPAARSWRQLSSRTGQGTT